MVSVNAKLRALRIRMPSGEEHSQILKQVNLAGNDRGAAILLTTYVERTIAQAISLRIPGAANHYSKLFENDGMLSTLDCRIIMANVLGIIGPTTVENLNTIKHVRNTFAHASIAVTFETQEIKDACSSLTTFLRDEHPEGAKKQYASCCLAITTGLVTYSRSITDYIHKNSLAPLNARTVVPYIPASLP